MNVTIEHIEEIIKLSKKPKYKLRKINDSLERLYNGKGLTKNHLIFQIVFLMDSPK